MPTDTIPARLLRHARELPTSAAWHTRAPDGWRARTWADVATEVRCAARAMIALGLNPGDPVSILGFNRPEWVCFHVAAMMAGGVPAGIYTTGSPAEVAYVIRHSASRLVLVENAAQLAKVQAERATLPDLQHIVMMGGADAPEGTLAWTAFLAAGNDVPEADLDARLAALKDDDLATLIYTSGTTGPPKGVMLSHGNLAWTAACAQKLVSLVPTDFMLSYLPLSHIAEQMFTIHAPMTVGCAVYFAEAIDKVPDNLKEVQPTIFFGVPRIWEKFHAGIGAKLAAATGIKSSLASWALGVGRRVAAERREGRVASGFLGFQHMIAEKLVASKVRTAVGLGRARFCVTGAAPISRDILEFFGGLGLDVLEVYGQSEGSGPTTFNIPGRTRLGTVGPALPNIEVKLGDDGEVLVRGPNVFLGYYKEPAATAETLQDGWLLSGDLGAFDADGFLSIVGRKKEIIITAGGKNIAPRNIEEALKAHPLVGDVMVIGDRRAYLTAVVTLEPEALARLATELGVAPGEAHAHPKVREEVQKGVEAANAQVAPVSHVRKFAILPRPFSVDGGELTATLKLKRKVAAAKYAGEIEALYLGDDR